MAYKEKDTKKWTAQWFETNAKGEKKKRRKRGFETKREALEYERQKKLNNSRSMDMKLSEFMEVYFEDKQNELKERTMKNKRYMMEQHIVPYFGNQMMSEITAGQIIQWQNEMQTKGFSEAYLRMIQNQLTSLYTHEPLMQNLLDTHMSVVGLKQITEPVDILNQSDLEKELEQLGSLRSKADAIQAKLTKSISVKRDENPAYYDSFSKRIKDALQEYKDRVITDAEYLAKMRSIMQDYAAGVSTVKYPEKLKGNVHAQAFYGVVSAILENEWEQTSDVNCVAENSAEYGGKPISAQTAMLLRDDSSSYTVSGAQVRQDMIADISIKITDIVERHSRVDWTNNKSIHDKIAQDIDDMFYEYECAGKCKFSFEVIDKVIENVKTTALRRFKG